MPELNLFTQYDRNARQKMCLKSWLLNNLRGTVEASTGFGKTRVALNAIKLLLEHYPNYKFIVVVPTDTLKEQWLGHIDSWGFGLNAEVVIINSLIKKNWDCDVLIIDEVHRMASAEFSKIFDVVKYKYILGLTATFERLDGKHELLAKYCPVVDSISSEEALVNGWVSPFKEYLVLIDVDDIDKYKQYSKEFNEHFEFFNWDFKEAMACTGPRGFIKKIEIRDRLAPKNASKEELSSILKKITIHSAGFNRMMNARKQFINYHPKKIDIVRKIMDARPNSKIITFSNNVAMAEKIEGGKFVYSGQDSKKKGRIKIEEFQKATSGHLHTIRKADEGLDIKGLSIAIILGLDSSKTKATQRRGRAIRFEEGKNAEIFNIVINNTVECEWFKNSHKGDKYITIDEKGLEQVLKGEEPTEYKKPVQRFTFRY